MIDWTRVGELRDEVGEEDLLDIADIFLDEMAEAIDPLRGGAEPAALPEFLHFLKGASLNMGFGTLGATCTAAEQAPDKLSLTQIVTQFDASRQALLDGLAEFA